MMQSPQQKKLQLSQKNRLIGQNVLIKTAVTLVNTGVQRFNLFQDNFEGGQNVLIKCLRTIVDSDLPRV